MILTGKEIKNYSIEKLIGKPIKFSLRKMNTIGSRSFFVKSFTAKNKKINVIKINTRCNIQKYTNGILIRFNNSNKISVIPVNNNDIIKIKLQRGKEKITPSLFSLFNLLIKLNVPIRYARYVAWKKYEYQITETTLLLEFNDVKMKLITNGYNYENQLSFIDSLNSKLNVFENLFELLWLQSNNGTESIENISILLHEVSKNTNNPKKTILKHFKTLIDKDIIRLVKNQSSIFVFTEKGRKIKKTNNIEELTNHYHYNSLRNF